MLHNSASSSMSSSDNFPDAGDVLGVAISRTYRRTSLLHISLREGTSSECHISQANRTKHEVTSLCPNRRLTLGGVAPREVFPLAKAAVLRALQIGSTLGEAHLSLALITRRYDWDWVSVQLGNSVTLKIFPSGSLNQAIFAPVGVNPTLMLPAAK
jgi:hypothetical protein